MKIESSAFQNGSEIPRKYGYKKDNINPPISIKEIPDETKSLALIMDDPDAMGAVGKIWVHWIVWNIDPSNLEIKENSIPLESLQGKTDFGEISYGGPAPPDKEHTYIFKLYALDEMLNINEGSTKSELEEAMKGHVLSEAKLEGKYAP
ncbi:MAG: YbhB/YbcL family Raf kinase inhibitor-like protein [Nitrosopumilaceae archaeon]|jgi:Raf kinase inhibitor-like YbhB/YbcL family protein|uniref:YbhB/YbcL family Raf kinase inhibitor-like protein n=3 Tax=Candidatus Nitrosomaritimum aestuariumsis TaxID=3342354 RepID=A0AC60W578_9ARCH|nr:YbhB/YbcL family Raf kinase inhibitor-like protein [Nitrosopumilaceae archaeon]MBA4454828.1 YbhB/YbcL family Raf kinase inhibitor-like protein [Nitrosopumilaceae archaeon]MBA4460819.1 YbhB/YbcL family Raf kinase inhibitor-like protein [Nitrosopumilaceae archaeon]MBA4461346.1 YbhB/YbcL family Raf kinase inhibitor-like protein [Nitrosopumilaceae archaeon]MBA4463378.1 YbhB/YbcL family Raf kinase inhibitor-like protein [Nitrosopumilaceae archaeon]